MSSVAKLIERLSIAVVGEPPEVVVEVLAQFTLELLARYGFQLDRYIEVLKAGFENPPSTPPS